VYCTLLDAASLARTTLASDPPSFIPAGSIPTDVAFSPAGTWAYVTNQQARTIGVLDARRDRQVATIAVEGDPYRVVVGPEGQVVYTTTNLGNLVRIDSETRTVSWTVHLGGNLNGLAISPDGSRIYVGDVTGKLYEVAPNGEILRSMALPGHPQGLALPSRGQELYVAGEAGDLIVVDLEGWAEATRVRLDAGGFGIAVSPDQAQIWITAPHSGKLFVLDRSSRAIVNTIVLGGMPRRLAFDQSGTTAVVADETGAILFLR
jgi:YVTN family beta-propeller protein